jgi:serine/threonine protein kinase
LGSYRYGERYNLVFPLADGDLAALFENKGGSIMFQSDDIFLVAVAGLASALEHVHEFVDHKLNLQLIGFHHDIRPRNILVSGENLLLADFGLSRFKGEDETSKTIFKQGTDSYLAPECQDLETYEKHRIGRSSDIWSFGCILAELMVYRAFGPDGVKQFKDSRAFKKGPVKFGCFHCGTERNPGVERWLSNPDIIGSRSSRSLVTLIRRMISLKEEERPKAKDVTACLRSMAISNATETIDPLFERIPAKRESLDAFLELKRFEAWKHGIGVVDHNGAFTTECSISLDDKTFSRTLQHLNNMRDCLSPMSNSDTKVPGTTDIRELARLNDYLENILDKQQQGQARTYFSSAVLESRFSESFSNVREDSSLVAVASTTRLRAALKSMTKLLFDHSTRDTDHRQIQRECVKDLEAFNNHHVGIFTGVSGGMRILVEWHVYGRQ